MSFKEYLKNMWCKVFHFQHHRVKSVGNWVVTTQCKKCKQEHYSY